MQANSDIQKRDLKVLLEMFEYACCLEDIASAYCQARCNVDLPAEILCASHGTAENLVTSASHDKLTGASKPLNLSSVPRASAEPANFSSVNQSPKNFHEQRDSRAWRSKVCPASLGTVSGIVGRDYIKPKTSTSRYPEVKKPLKLDAKELPADEIWGEKPSLGNTMAKGTVRDDVVSFLFKMLGDGFELEKTKIR